MKNLRKRFDIFCFRNRNKGISNLMLYIVLGNAVVYLMSMFAENFVLYDILCFDRDLVLQGQVWRLFSYVFTSFSGSSNLLLVAISYLCYWSLGKAIENLWGTLRFNLFYLSGVLMMDIFAMCFGGILVNADGYLLDCSMIYHSMGSTLNLTLFLSYATLFPNAHFLLFFIGGKRHILLCQFPNDLFIFLCHITYPRCLVCCRSFSHAHQIYRAKTSHARSA